MDTKTTEEIRAAVRIAYGARAEEVLTLEVVSSGAGACCGSDCCADERSAQARQAPISVEACCGSDCCGESGADDLKQSLYQATDIGELPESVVSYGCGNPVALASLRPGEVVLDLGSGAGLDCFLAAGRVGPTGRVIGLDMTDSMLELAERNRAKLSLPNVEFRHGTIESIPLPDASVDIVISNCVINLSPDKDAVFREVVRVLRPGGRFHIADVVLLEDLNEKQRHDLDLWAGCVSGALHRDNYAARLRSAGLRNVDLTSADTSGEWPHRTWASAIITAERP